MSGRGKPDVSLTWRTGDDPPPEEWPAIYAAGSTVDEIALRTGHHRVHVRDVLLAAGVQMRGSHPRPAVWPEQAAALRARGLSYAEIGREVGKTGTAVQMALLRRARRLAGQQA